MLQRPHEWCRLETVQLQLATNRLLMGVFRLLPASGATFENSAILALMSHNAVSTAAMAAMAMGKCRRLGVAMMIACTSSRASNCV